MYVNTLPWQREAQRRLLIAPEKFPPALLVVGRQGVGKLAFARLCANALLCEKPGHDGDPCGDCPTCQWFEQDAHPDFRLVQPEAMSREDASGVEETESAPEKRGGKQITIDQIRALADFVALTSHRDGPKVVLIHPADDLNPSAANALLKTLEEPPPRTFFILVSHRPHRLPATLLSRCQMLPIPVPRREESLAWLSAQGVRNPECALAEAGFAPLRALEVCGREHLARRHAFLEKLAAPGFDPVAVAGGLAAEQLSEVMGWLQKWVYDAIAMNLTGRVRYNADFCKELSRQADRIDPLTTARFLRQLVRDQALVNHPLNRKLLFEQLLICYRRMMWAEPPESAPPSPLARTP